MVTANPGCILQIQAGLRGEGSRRATCCISWRSWTARMAIRELSRCEHSASRSPTPARAQGDGAAHGRLLGPHGLRHEDAGDRHSGAVIRELLTAGGHSVVGSGIVRDEPADVQRVVREACAHGDVQAVIITGGTGITSRDSTFEAVEALLDKRLPGFGELFRMLSYQEIGAAAMLSRAQLGIHSRRIVVSLPGSPNACRLALEKLLVPELRHLLREVSR